MKPNVRMLFDHPVAKAYRRRSPLILVNGLAEQAESWFANRPHWSRHYDVKIPEILVYGGETLHRHIDQGGEVTVDYLTDRLATYLDEYVQKPPYRLVGSSLGGQIMLTYAARHPQRVQQMVFLCPSGIHGEENLPVMEGVKRSQYDTLVRSVFHSRKFATDDLIRAFETKFQDRKWKKGVLRTLRGTMGHSVCELLEHIPHPCLFIWGAEDHVIADVPGSIRAAERLLKVRQVVIPKCGHAPQIEKAKLVNELVLRFLHGEPLQIPPALEPARYLAQSRNRAAEPARLAMGQRG